MADKVKREELIAALVTDKHSGYKNGDEPMLETCSDVRLEEFRVAAENRQQVAGTTVRLETEKRNLEARVKVLEDRIRGLEASVSDDEFVARLAAESPIRKLIEAHQAEEEMIRKSLITQLSAFGADNEDVLTKKTTDELRQLARYARVEEPDFSGRGVMVDRQASDNTKKQSYMPPSPYSAGLKRLQEQVKH